MPKLRELIEKPEQTAKSSNPWFGFLFIRRNYPLIGPKHLKGRIGAAGSDLYRQTNCTCLPSVCDRHLKMVRECISQGLSKKYAVLLKLNNLRRV